MSWRKEKHFQIVSATYSTKFKWGACIINQGRVDEFGDFWDASDSRPIHVKKASALLKALISVKHDVKNKRVYIYCDNQAVVCAWNNQGAKDLKRTLVMKDIFEFTVNEIIDLGIQFISSVDNSADSESRRDTLSDSKISPGK